MGFGQPPGGRVGPVDVTQPGAGRLPIRLRVQLGTRIGQVYTMSGDTLTIGRAPDNDLVLDDAQVSRYHARLICRGDEVLLEDLGSTNGTLVNGRRTTGAHALQPTETIAVGGTVFSIEGFAAPDTLGMLPVGASRGRHQPEVPAAATPSVQSAARSGVPWAVIAGLAGLLIVVILILALGGMLSFLLSSQGTPVAPSVPSVFVQSPVAGSEVRVNQPVTVSAVASDANGVARVELWVAGVLVAQQQVPQGQSATTLQVELRWTPTAPGGYTLELKAYNTLGAVSESTALLVIAAPEPGSGAATEPAGGSSPESGQPLAVTTADLNVRAGPGQDYTILGLVPAGTEMVIVGQNPESTWWQVIYPADSSERGWVFANFTRATNAESVPVVVTPGPPLTSSTETPMPTPTYTRVVVPKPKPTAAPTPVPTPVPVAGPIADMTVSRASIAPGECVTLQWHIENVKAAFLTGGEFQSLGLAGPYGSRDVCPGSTTTYVLRADTDAGVVERPVTVEVAGLPQVPADQLTTVNAKTITVNAQGSPISGAFAGDDSSNRGMRVLVSFDVASLRGVAIGSAQLDLAAYEVVGNPFTSLGALSVDDLGSEGAPNQDNYAREAPGLSTIDNPAALSQSIDVTDAVARLVATGPSTFVVRLRFANETNQNNADDFVKWGSLRLLLRVRQ